MITEKDFAAAVNSRSKAPLYEKMKAARVGIAGLGGLGSNVAAALARSGAGSLVIADFDVVELSNINRQIYSLSHIGMKKTAALCEILRGINPFCDIKIFDGKITEENCAEIFSGCDIVCEAFDSAECKAMLVNALLAADKNVKIVSGSGLAGVGRANEIATKKISERLFVCGDLKSDVEGGEGLSAARVMVCAGHQACKITELILSK